VTDIAFAVGYNSLGSFSNHFTDSVGISPGRFRRASHDGGIWPPRWSRESPAPNATATGTILFPAGYAGARAYVAAFDTPIVQRRPAAAVIVGVSATTAPALFRLTDVPRGSWYFHAVAVADNADPEPWTRRTLLVGGSGPVSVAAGSDLSIEIELRPKQPTDLPILLALPDLEPPRPEVMPELVRLA
jgi:hypothetical protein